MINILSYVGMNMQSEVCLWCLLGLVRTIFDATLFKVNANLKQVWQMTMPEELTMPVQRVLRTMVSGVMLVQCFTVYVYLASYIVLLYPVFLEERPTLVLPWLLLAAVRKLLCELTSLALGLGTCVLLGPARPPCIKFVVVKFTSIMPAFYMWMLVFSYYHALKVATAFKTFPAVLPPNDNDYGLELAVRRRRTKSLLGEEQLRKKLVAHFYGERTASVTNETYLRPTSEMSSRMVHSTDTSIGEEVPEADVIKPLTVSTTGWSDIGAYEDWFGSEVMIPRDTDRILEQIVLMLLRIGAYLKKEGIESILDSQKLNSAVPASWHQRDNIDCAAMNADDTDTPPQVGSSKGNMASYLREYPQIFMKKLNTDNPQTERTIASLKTVHSHVETDEGNISKNKVKRISPGTSKEIISVEVEKIPSKRKLTISDNTTTHEDKTVKLTWPSQLQTKQTTKVEEKINRSKLKKQRDSEHQSKKNISEIINKVQNDLQLESKNSTGEVKKQSSNSKIKYKNKDATDTQPLNDDNEEYTHSRQLDENNHKMNANNSKKSTEYKTTKEKTNERLTNSKISNSDNSNEPLDDTILNKDIIGESTLGQNNVDNTKDFSPSRISSEDYNKKFIPNIITNELKYKDSNDGTISIESTNKDLIHGLISDIHRSKEPPGIKISDEDSSTSSTYSDILDIGKNKIVNQQEFTHSQRSTDNKKSNYDNTIDFLDVKISNKDVKGESTHSMTLNKDKSKEFIQKEISNKNNNKEFTHSEVSNEGKNKISIDIKISDEANDKDSTDGKIANKDSTDSIPDSNSNKQSKAKNSKNPENNT